MNLFLSQSFDKTRRAQAPGQFVQLAAGVTHFDWHGPQPGKVLVLVHGFSTPSFVWRGVLPALTEAGYRVLTYDLFGRGWSDRPKAAYSLAFHRRQLEDLLASQDVTHPFYLAGYSMGGLIAADFAARAQAQVERLFLIAPAGLGTTVGGIPKALTWPGIGPFLAETVMQRRLLADMGRPENAGASLPDLQERYQEQMRFPGYMRALRSTLLHLPLASAEAVYARLATTGIPTAAIWGSADAVTPPGGADVLARTMPQVQTTLIDGATHAITYAQPDDVSGALIRHGRA